MNGGNVAAGVFEKVTIKFDGEKHEFVLGDLDLAYPENPTDEALKTALAQRLGVETRALDEYVADRFEQTIHVRPAATLG